MPTIHLAAQGADLLTRDQGAQVRKRIEQSLHSLIRGDRLEIDLSKVGAITPSFMDECFGRLILLIGEERFRQEVKLSGGDEATRRLLNKVLAHRASELREDRPQ